jgi:hypothetical protein
MALTKARRPATETATVRRLRLPRQAFMNERTVDFDFD